MKTAVACTMGAILAVSAPASALADEGMWTFDDVPLARVEQSLGVTLDQPWLDHLRRASVRLTSGCSGAVVSRRGLVLTNQHCLMACIQGLSTLASDHLRDGFGLDAEGPEQRCPGVQAEILEGIADITEPVFAASAGKLGPDFVAAREAVIARAERGLCGTDRRLRCQTIAFFGGGQFKVYKYRVFDVGLVFAPEYAMAFFGGDPENFTFPRFDLDFAFLRLYEGAASVKLADWLAWSSAAPRAGEPVFVSGNPGATERAFTVAQLESERDIAIPLGKAQDAAVRDALLAFAGAGPEAARLAADPLFAQENALKLIAGRGAALTDPIFLAQRRTEEDSLKARLAVDRRLAGQVGDPWAEIAAVQKTYVAQYGVWRALESGAGGGSELFAWARSLVRAAAERVKPSAQRLPEYADSRLPLVEKTVLDARPVSPELERLYLEVWLRRAKAGLGPDSAATAALLAGETPGALAARLAGTSRLGDPAVRRALWDGGVAALARSDDPMIVFVLKTDALSRAAREVWESEVIGPSDRCMERIARVRQAVQGRGLYPDATFSLRLSWGKVAGWRGPEGPVPAVTTLGGLYGHATGTAPFALSPRWIVGRAVVDPAKVLDFVTTNDIVAGNSGSPAVNARGQVIGTAFDGNLPSIAGDFAYDGAQNRTVAVSSAAITEALAKVYGRPGLVRELEGH